MKGTLSFVNKEVKFKTPSGFMVEYTFIFNSHNSGNFHSTEKNKLSKSNLGSRLSKTKSITEIEQKVSVLLLIKRSTVCGTPGIIYQNIQASLDSDDPYLRILQGIRLSIQVVMGYHIYIYAYISSVFTSLICLSACFSRCREKFPDSELAKFATFTLDNLKRTRTRYN